MTRNPPTSRRYWLSGKRADEQDRFFREALEARGWQEGDAEHWNAGWVTGMPDRDQFRKVSAQHRLNHFPGNNALTVKSRLHETLSRMRQRFVEQFGSDHEAVSRLDFFPRAYLLPRDYHALQQAALEQPEKRWILKPTNASKGKGIKVLRDPADVPMEDNWMVQEYLENPHTIRGHKYVLRLYVLVSSIEPLRVYLYRQGFAKLASAPYDPEDMDNPYSQLTNPDINALNTEAELPVEFIDLDRYRQWLRDQGHDDQRLFTRIHDLLTLTLIAASDDLHRRTALSGADPRGCYELLGIDCLIDTQLKPWILECNLSPSLGTCAAPDDGGREEEVIKRGLVNDMLSLVGIDESLTVIDSESPSETAHREAQEELARAGDFLRLYPHAKPERYLPLFTFPSRADVWLASGLSGRQLHGPWLQRRYVTEVIDDNRLALYASRTGRYYQLNDSAAMIWLLATEGVEPDAIADQLALSSTTPGEAEKADRETIRQEVWQCLTQWCRDGLLMQQGNASPAAVAHSLSTRPQSDALPITASRGVRLACGGQQWAFYSESQPVMARLAELFSPRSNEGDNIDNLPRLEVLRDAPGYALSVCGEVVAKRLPLADVGPALVALLMRRAAQANGIVLDVSLLSGGEDVLCLLAPDEKSRLFAQHLAEELGASLSQGISLDTQTFAMVPLGLPARGLKGRFTSAPSLPSVAIQPQAIVWLHHSPDAEVPVTCQPLSLLDALGKVLPQCNTHDGHPVDGPTVEGLSDWLSEFRLLSLNIADEREAVRALGTALSIECVLPSELSLTEN